jgi:hypothetical protein
VNVALDAALSFAESMGFLFDDDMVDDDAASQEKAVLRWQEMIGEVGAGSPAAVADGEPVELFDADGGELTDPPEPAEPVPAAALLAQEPGPPERSGDVVLTKFRVEPSAGAEPAPQTSEAAAGRALREASRQALGRMRLVKRPGKQPAQDARRAWLLRLLTSF